ncbi:uncharacterized protein UMAG_01660 [Mycosarcoma maydis]|uniref:Uncharacterized protein n=1 Tax=Mycosarcoma maydis TaxID=5270 RepID=A0A0D1E448_MYCMD|nr:uncharacterized protein UMAG_01660 [Ustilago maydis 521]KIS70486.1 hypothetical protein UMAG_01660 [Ustilago maydis 521]|eukprot:XP_011387644.1 hypothetical protein UMAG_01660 [Ustilago maydis 521]
MAQPGSTEPKTSFSPVAATGAMTGKAVFAPTKAPSDDEAEEGEIIDEEEGEICEGRPSEPAADAAAPSQLATAIVAEPAQESQSQPTTAELPFGTIIDSDEKQQADTKAQSQTQVTAEDTVASSVQASQAAESAKHSSEQTQPSAEPVPASISEENPTEVPALESTNPKPTPETAASLAPTDVAAEPQEPVAQTTAPQESKDPTPPALTETAAPESDVTTATATAGQTQSNGTQDETRSQTLEDPTVAAASPPPAEAHSKHTPDEAATVETISRDDEPADMEIDDKAEVSAQPTVNDTQAPAVPDSEPMQVDDSVQAPALPEDLGAPATVKPALELAVEDQEELKASVEESAPSPPHFKSEPQAEADEQSHTGATQAPEAIPSEPATSVVIQTEDQEPAEKQGLESAKLAVPPEPSAELQSPRVRQRSATPRISANASTLEVPTPEEVQRRATVERDDVSVPRPTEVERARSRMVNSGSAAPRSGQERRLERERTKDRPHPPEHSQDREQRAREKDRRRELERVERERERERERIRESERDREMMIARENEEARLIWLSLPGNDHPQYYTDTDSDSCYGVGGALGVDLTDEEDKDLNPPLPLSLQAYHPAPSYSKSYFDDSYYSSKRKRTDDAGGDGLGSSSRRYRRKPISPPSPIGRVAPMPRNALASTTMIDIDDFPVPDSSIRGEPSERPFESRIERASLPRISPHGRGEDALEELDSSDSDEEALLIAEERKRRHGHRSGNRGNKLSRDKGARWVRRGKLGGWTEMRMEKEIGDRVRHRVEAMQKDSIRALLSAMPEEDKSMLAQFPALRNGLILGDAPSSARRDARGRLLASDLSEAARIDAELGLDAGGAGAGAGAGASGSRLERPEHLTSTSLAPTLLKPAITPRQLLTSHTLRHTFRNPHIAALGKTALDLIESEGVVGRAVGRCWAAMERGGWNEDPEPKCDEADEGEHSDHQNGVNGMDVDGSDVEGSMHHGGEQGNGASAVFGSITDNPALSHLDKLFVTKQGLAIPRLDDMGQPIFVPASPATQAARAHSGLAEEAANEAVIETTMLPAPEQRSIVLAALECLHDLAADSREYVERLEEVRSRLAAVKRRRAQVWNAVRQWALEKDEASDLTSGTRGENGLSAVETVGVGASVVPTVAVANGASPKKRK